MKIVRNSARANAGILWMGSLGCAMVQAQDRYDSQGETVARSLRMEADVGCLKEQVQGLEQARLDTEQRLGHLETAPVAANPDERIRALEQKVKELDAARETDRQAIIDELSRKMAAILNTQTPPPDTQPVAIAEGKGHVVQTGETLSGLAARYHVKSADILKANHIKNPDSIKVGQTLIIPE